MSDKTIRWHGDGIYSKIRTGRDGQPIETFYVRVWIPSERKTRTWKAGHTPKQAARKARQILGDPDGAAAARARARQAQKQERSAAYTVADLCAAFTATYRARGGSADFYRQILKHPVAQLGKMPVADLSPALFDRYLAGRRLETTKGKPRKVDGKTVMVGAGLRKVSESSLRKVIVCLGTMLKWGRARGLVTVNPLADFRKPHEPGDRVTRALTHDEEKAVLELLPPLERDVVEWAIYSGMRRGEILSLAWPRIDRGRGVVHVMGTKTGKARVLPLSLSGKLPAILDRHPRRTNADLLFHDTDGSALDVDRLNGNIEAAMKTAGVPKTRGVMWNLFRKTWASRLYANGRVMPQDEAAWGGHGIAVAMKHYVEFSPAAQERAAGALDILPATGARTGAVNRQTA
jgi:integrase